ncbi:hypothetical protein XENOCAPTIV_024021 [Xenoophorus captivus]|uniref:Uncharacterized protein n=1 Tax=Xenoophorus captivus TaxID=1517983 RepID=A0ABV0R1V2_9TELE
MECNTAQTQCTIGLARRPCQELTGWTELCQSHYEDEYNTYAHEVEGVWRRSLGGGSTCAEIVLGHNLRHRKSIMDVIVPFSPDSVIALAELYDFRLHLCSGSMDKGLDWVGHNLFYSNLTCKPPKETWKNCGEGAYQHACTWYETLGHSIGNVITIVAQEAGHIIGEGVSVVEGWIANLFMMLWPYLLAAVGVIIIVIICKVLAQQFLRSMLTSGRRSYRPLPSKEGPPRTRCQVIWTSAFGAAARTFKIRPWQGGLYLPIISYIWRDPTDGFWLPTLHLLDGRVVAIGAHGSPDSPPRVTEVQVRQVSTTTTESSTQTSVTTKSVTCQTTVGDNDE